MPATCKEERPLTTGASAAGPAVQPTAPPQEDEAHSRPKITAPGCLCCVVTGSTDHKLDTGLGHMASPGGCDHAPAAVACSCCPGAHSCVGGRGWEPWSPEGAIHTG